MGAVDSGIEDDSRLMEKTKTAAEYNERHSSCYENKKHL
jgi:hypothetical protein